MGVSAQVSVYPLGQGDPSSAIHAAWEAFRAHRLEYQPGSMSTLLQGDTEQVFAALHDAFQAAAERGATVMVITVSNACPPLPSREAVAGDA